MKLRFDRYMGKVSARSSMHLARPNPMLVTLVYLLLAGLLPNIILGLTGRPIFEAARYLEVGYQPEEVFRYVFRGSWTPIWTFCAVALVLGFFLSVVGFGYTAYCLRVSRKQDAGFGSLLEGFTRLGRIILRDILVNVFSFLWAIPCIAPSIIAAFLTAGLGEEWAMSIFFSLYFAGIVALIFITTRYRLTSYFLLDDPDCTAMESIRRSRTVMKGRAGELILLDLSFLAWELLSLVTCGILDLWLAPYRGVTEAKFYEFVSDHGNAGGYTDAAYGPGPDNGREPF